MKRVKLFMPVILFTVVFYGCVYNNEEELYGNKPSDNCNTENVTYTGIIKPILTARCYSCHSNSAANSFGAGINLENFNELTLKVTSGKLLGVITHSPGFQPMPQPQGAVKLDDCSIEKIRTWINNGAKND